DGYRRIRGGLQRHGSRAVGSGGPVSARPVLDLGKAPLEHGDHVVPVRVRLLVVEQRLHAGRVEPAQPGAERGDREVAVARDWRSLDSGRGSWRRGGWLAGRGGGGWLAGRGGGGWLRGSGRLGRGVKPCGRGSRLGPGGGLDGGGTRLGPGWLRGVSARLGP